MKWILYLLVLANAAFFAWQYQLRAAVRAASEAREAARPAYVTRLVLLSEAPERGGEPEAPGVLERAEARPAPASPAEEPKPDGVSGVREVPAPVSPVVDAGAPAAPRSAGGAAAPAPAGEVLPPPAATSAPATPVEVSRVAASPVTAPLPAPAPVTASVLAGPAPSVEPAAAPPVVPAAPASSPPSTGESAGLPPGEAALDRAGPPAPAPTVTEVAQTRRCYRVGPLAEDAPVDPVRTWLVQHGGEVESRVEQRQEPRSFWVHLPPAPSPQAAREAADRLQAEGVKDVMRVTAGAKANAISLGLYNRRAAADQRVSELKRAGYAAEVETRFKEVRETWLDATFSEPKEPPREVFRAAFP